MIYLLKFIFPLVVLVQCQSSQCSENKVPSQLVAVAVWTRESNGTTSYRISDEDLTSEGYERGRTDRQDVVTLLARSPGGCTLGECTLQLSANIRESDGAIIHQENVLGIPIGFKDLEDSFYCARRFGDCGAHFPVFRFTRGSGSSMTHAYSLDSTASFSGFPAKGKILCYGWSDSGSVVHPIPADAKGCLPHNYVANGKVTYSETKSPIYSVGTTATLVCDEGYKGGGQSAVLCTRSGWYPSIGLGYCVHQNKTQLRSSSTEPSNASVCAALGLVHNGQLLYNDIATEGRFPQGTRATVLCNLGYEPVGKVDTYCKEGKWDEKLATCQSAMRHTCPPLFPPLGGSISYNASAPYASSTIAKVTCDIGLKVVGTSELMCTNSGWSPLKFGECMQNQPSNIGCGPVTVLGGTTTYIQANSSVPYSSGTSVFVMCNVGYTPQGSMSALCQNGTWSPALGTCTYSTQAAGLSNTLTPVPFGSTSTGVTSCSAITTPSFGTVSYSPSGNIGSYSSGTTAILTCNLGYTVSGSSTSTCSNGAWIPPVLGACIQGIGGLGTNSVTDCLNPIVINGVVSYSQGSGFDTDKPTGTVATLTCNLGYSPSGSTIATCQNGVWTPMLGRCTSSNGLIASTTNSGLTCSSLFTPFGGTVSYSTGNNFGQYSSGTIATLQCSTGFPQGTSSSLCSNGQWSPPALGTCSNGTGGSSGLTCTSLLAPIGGTLVYSTSVIPYPSGTTVALQCLNGAFPAGSSSSTCSNGQWTPTLGTCSSTTTGLGGLTCPAMTTPFGAMVNYSNGAIFGPFSPGTTVTMTCLSGTPSGTTFATCLNGQWNPPTLGTCSSTSSTGGGLNIQCPALTAPPGGTIMMSSGPPGAPAPQGTIATLICPSGVQGTSSVLCSNGAWTPPTLGTCTGSSGTMSPGGACQLAPTTPIGATLSYSNLALLPPFPSGTTSTARCISGTPIIGTSTITCLNGLWQPSTFGTCGNSVTGAGTGLTCPSIQPIGGTVDYSDGAFTTAHASGSTATLLCTSGTPIGSALSTCQNGQWIPTIGSCSTTGVGGGQCTLAPPLPLGATVSYSMGGMLGPWNNGAMATVTCPFGQSMIGSSTATCSNGVWTALGTCSATGVTGTDGLVGGTSLPCYFGLIAPLNGNITYTDPTPPYSFGTIATLICDPGYRVSGMSTSSCANGLFTPIGFCLKS